MKLLVYLVFYGIVFPLSKLPFSILYKISDGFYFIVYHIIGYRKEVVWQNLKNSFPEKTHEELQVIRKQFFHNFCDLIVENIKFFSITPEEAKSRCTVSNPEVVDNCYKNNPCMYALTGHLGNWEFAGIGAGLGVKFWPVVSYKPFSNKSFEKIMTEIRSRYFSIVPYYNVKEETQKTIETGLFNINQNNPSRKPVFIFLPDQAPSQKNSFYWVNFLNQETAFYTKVEDMAKEFQLPVVFCDIERIKRGYFKINLTLLAENAAKAHPLQITNQYIALLEQNIYKNPANWLWSHKRWKRKRIN
jgi:KDO2-lipid IV(A) lauroyltransferase